MPRDFKQEGNTLPGKRQKLAASGTLNPAPEKVHDSLFQSHTFFDPQDAIQVKYEMLRRVEKDGRSVTQAARDFGFSRRHFYDLQQQFAEHGFEAFVPKQRGPKGAINLPMRLWTSSIRRVKPPLVLRPPSSVAGCTSTSASRSIPEALRRPWQAKKKTRYDDPTDD